MLCCVTLLTEPDKERLFLLGVHGEREGGGLNKDDRIAKVLNSLYEVVACSRCGTRIRFGDVECPHCGIDVDDELRQWAARLLDKLTP